MLNQNGNIIWSPIHHDQLSYKIWKLSDKEELHSQREAGWMNEQTRRTDGQSKKLCPHTIVCGAYKWKFCIRRIYCKTVFYKGHQSNLMLYPQLH